MKDKQFIKGGKTEALMSMPPKHDPDDMTRKTFYINEKSFKEFAALCKAHGRSTSEAIDALIQDFVATYSKT